MGILGIYHHGHLGLDLPIFFVCVFFCQIGDVMCGLCLNVFSWKFEENLYEVVVCEWECGCLFGTKSGRVMWFCPLIFVREE